MNDQDFYSKCAQILGVDHTGLPFTHYKRTRWNNRTPGQGRFPGYGIIRKFGSQYQVALSNPKHHGIYNSEQEVFELLRKLISV